MRDHRSRIPGLGLILVLGLLPSLGCGLFIWLSGTWTQGAADALTQYQHAPPCAGAPAAGCRAVLTTTVVTTYVRSSVRTSETHIVVGGPDGARWDVVPGSGTPALAPGQPVTAEVWQDQVVRLGPAGTPPVPTQDYPARTAQILAGTNGLAQLGGILGLVWAAVFLLIFIAGLRGPAALAED